MNAHDTMPARAPSTLNRAAGMAEVMRRARRHHALGMRGCVARTRSNIDQRSRSFPRRGDRARPNRCATWGTAAPGCSTNLTTWLLSPGSAVLKQPERKSAVTLGREPLAKDGSIAEAAPSFAIARNCHDRPFLVGFLPPRRVAPGTAGRALRPVARRL